jgi:hypothetical protein
MRNKSSIDIELVGGLGNQLFGYFAGLYLAENSEVEIRFNLSLIPHGITHHGSSIKSFRLSENSVFTENKLRRIQLFARKISNYILRIFPGYRRILFIIKRVYVSREIGYDKNLITLDPGTQIRGYFQSWKYFSYILNRLSCELQIARPSSWFLDYQNLAKSIRPIMMHIRRGDYNTMSREFGLLDANYYRRAALQIREVVGSKEIWIFSDDLDAASAVILHAGLKNFRLVHPPIGHDPAESMMLMAEGCGNIISNSTFSWWSAMLNPNNPMVIAPVPWYRGIREPKDLIPLNWHQIGAEWTSVD